ncbi:methyl-accepting chemotaxis protein [uncultured Gammaproteobacteria bacterium]
MTLTLKTKMFGTVALLALLSVVMVVMGISSLADVRRQAQNVESAGDRTELTIQANLAAVDWVGSVEFLTISIATPQQVAAHRDEAAKEYKLFRENLDRLYAVVILEQTRQDIRRIRELGDQYKKAEQEIVTFFQQNKFEDVERVVIAGSPIIDEISHTFKVILERINGLQEQAKKEGQQAYDSGRTQLIVGATIGILAFVGLALWVVIGGVTRPLAAITEAMSEVAGGNFTLTVPGAGREDEIGQLAGALEIFRCNGEDKLRMEADQVRQRQEAEAEKRRTMARLADGFESSVKGVVSAVSAAATELQASAQSLTATADHTNAQCATVAAAAEQASTNVSTVAAATEELTSSINEISRQVSDSARIASQAVEEANRTNHTVASLSEAAQKIGEVVGLINNIASQTNLLALNATIEAARAGEAGKGFAVVASEVKNLANQTAKATEDIQSQVAQMQSVTGTAVDAIKGISKTIGRMSEITTTIASAVEEQGAATREISRNIQEASAGTQEVSGTIGNVIQTAAETGEMAGSVLGAAGELSRQSSSLQREVDGFIDRIRSS